MSAAPSTPSRGREWLIRVILLSFSLLLGLVTAEVTARIVFPISDGRDNVLLTGEKIKGYFKPGSVYKQVSNEYSALTTITQKGHRVPGVDGDASPDVVFIGDSFTYGWGLTDDESFAMIYCKELRVSCANLGIPGTGTLSHVERLEAFIDRWHWRPKEVKLFFFGMSQSFSSGNDFVDNYYRYQRGVGLSDPVLDRAMRAADGLSEEPEASPGDRPQAPRASRPAFSLTERVVRAQALILRYSTLMRLAKFYWGPLLKSTFVADPGDRMQVATIATQQALARLDSLSRRVGFEYTIYLIVPVQDLMRGSYPDTLATLNRVSPKPAVTTAPAFLQEPQSYYYSFDGHLNAKGSRRLAELLVSLDRDSTMSRSTPAAGPATH